MMDEQEDKIPLTVECPHCHVRVIPMADNRCPACREDMQYVPSVDPSRVALLLYESEELPSYCYSCNMYTERLVRISADEESGLETLFFGEKVPENTTNVIIFLPECELCSDLELELVEVDYDHQSLKIMAHPGFHDRVIQLREA